MSNIIQAFDTLTDEGIAAIASGMTIEWEPHLHRSALHMHWQTARYLGWRQDTCNQLVSYEPDES